MKESVFQDRRNPIDMYDDVEPHSKFRFYRGDILVIVDKVRDAIEYPITQQGSLQALLSVLVAH